MARKDICSEFLRKYFERSAFRRHIFSTCYTGMFHYNQENAKVLSETVLLQRKKEWCQYKNITILIYLFISKSWLWICPFKTNIHPSTLLSSCGKFSGLNLLLSFGRENCVISLQRASPQSVSVKGIFGQRNTSFSSETSTSVFHLVTFSFPAKLN